MKTETNAESKRRMHFISADNSIIKLDLAQRAKRRILQEAKEILATEEKHDAPVQSMQRTIPPVRKSLRRDLENYVIAWNTALRDAVKSMDVITLMRNAHPAYRPDFSRQLVEAGLLTDSEAGEFRIGPKTKVAWH